MQTIRQRMRVVCYSARAGLLGLLALLPLSSMAALERMDDAAMSDVSGAGIALGFEDFRWLTKPTSYYEQMGSDPVGETVFKRADMRWYGLSITAIPDGSENNEGFHWAGGNSTQFGNACNAGGLACPLGGTIANFSPYDNPYVLRSYAPHGFHYDGTEFNTDPDNPDQIVYEYVAPTIQPYYNFAFWGEIEAGRTGANENLSAGAGDFLKTQTLIQGNAAGSIFRMFEYNQKHDGVTADNGTFAIMYHSYLRGDFRFSAAHDDSNGPDSDVIGRPVIFDEIEGLHFKNVEAYIPLGQPFYQALTLDVARGEDGSPLNDGNFSLDIARLGPNLSLTNQDPTSITLNNAMADFYSYAVAENLTTRIVTDRDTEGNPTETTDYGIAGYITAHAALLMNTPGASVQNYGTDIGFVLDTSALERYNETHGYSRWGDWYPCNGMGCPAISQTMPDTRNSYRESGDGIFFQKCSGCENFNAFAYRLTAVDVRGNDAYNCPGGTQCDAHGFTPEQGSGTVADRYYVQSAECDASSEWCGYGGSYEVEVPAYSSATGIGYRTVNQKDPSEFYGVDGSTGALPVITTDRVNLGDSRIEGLQINYMNFTSLGSGNP